MNRSIGLLGKHFPRLSTIQFHPEFSVLPEDEKLSFYAHKDLAVRLKFTKIPPLVLDWFISWSYFWIRALPKAAIGVLRLILRKLASTDHQRK